MKHLFLIALVLFTLTAYSQHTTVITGSVLDLNNSNMPLTMASVTVKETGAKVMTNEKGAFKIEDLEHGNYTLVIAFTGYESKETKVVVKPNTQEQITVTLKASALSLDDLATVFASASKPETTGASN